MAPDVPVPVPHEVQEQRASSEAIVHVPHAEQHVVAIRKAPITVTQAERDSHLASGHAVYRSWCRACVAGRGKADPHVTFEPGADAVPKIGFDYGYFEKRADVPAGESPSPILISRSSKTWRLTAHVLPCKGVAHKHCMTAFVDAALSHGHTKFIAMSDNQPAILAISFTQETEDKRTCGCSPFWRVESEEVL